MSIKEVTHHSQPPNENSPQSKSRRRFLQKAVSLTALALVHSAIGSKIQNLFEVENGRLRFSSSQFGININPRTLPWYGLEPTETLGIMFDLPVAERVRIAVPFDEVLKEKGRWNIKAREPLIAEAAARGKKIDLQLGIKTIGWPEVHLPEWFSDVEEFHYLYQPSIIIDQNPNVRSLVLEYLDRTLPFYLQFPGVSSIQLENEPFSKRLPVTLKRSLTPKFNEDEVQVAQKYAPDIPKLQNIPFETPEAWWHILTHSDIVGINIYNQYSGMRISEKRLWQLTDSLVFLSRLFGKIVFFTELQAADWLGADKKSVSPFDPKKRLSALYHILSLRPSAILWWDVEQLVWRAKNGETEHLDFLNSLPQGI